MLSSWFCKPKLPATSTTIWRQVQGIVGRKSVTTNCRHWKAVRIKDSLGERTQREVASLNQLQCLFACNTCAYIPIQESAKGVTALFVLLFLPLVISDGSYDTQDEGPAGPQTVTLTLENLQDTLQLFLPDVCMEHVGQLLQGVKQHKLQPLGKQHKKQMVANEETLENVSYMIANMKSVDTMKKNQVFIHHRSAATYLAFNVFQSESNIF